MGRSKWNRKRKVSERASKADKDHKGKEHMKEGEVLNRVLRRTAHGYELEADLLHVLFNSLIQ